MVLRAKEPKRSAISSCAGPKTRRKSLARNLPNLLAAIAVIAFTDASKTARCYHLAKKLKGGRRAPNLNAYPSRKSPSPAAGFGTERKCRGGLTMSASGGKAENIGSQRVFRLLIQLGHRRSPTIIH